MPHRRPIRGLDPLLVEPSRLFIAVALAGMRWRLSHAVHDEVGASGAFFYHLNLLRTTGYVEMDAFAWETWIRLTPLGTAQLSAHLLAMEATVTRAAELVDAVAGFGESAARPDLSGKDTSVSMRVVLIRATALSEFEDQAAPQLVYHFAAVADTTALPQRLHTYCGAEFVAAEVEVLDVASGTPCSRCLSVAPLPPADLIPRG